MMKTRNLEASRRFSERREREDHAPRLREEVPDLEVLDLVLSERRAESEKADTTHTRRIVISAAPAYFQSNCGDTNCLDGGHEYTRQVMQPLREGATRFEAEHTCFGNVGNRTCGRILHILGTARFRAR
jgi:hypothetical protein